jgi:hypothetical protein
MKKHKFFLGGAAAQIDAGVDGHIERQRYN